MARESNRLTVAAIRAAHVGDVLEDGLGLRCIIGETGARWVLRYTSPVTHKRREAGLGLATLKQARIEADKLRDVIRQGRDPLHDADEAARREREADEQRKREAVREAATLRECARDLHKRLAPTFRNAKHAKQWLQSMEGTLPAALWNKPIHKIGTAEVAEVLLALRKRVPETARRVRQRMEAVFADAAVRELCDKNPAQLVAPVMRERGRGDKPHFRRMHYRDVPDFLARLRASERVGMSVRLAVEFAVMCASRSGEVRGMRWSEVDRAAKLWTVPASRMKGGQAHRVHLSPRALEILGEAEALRAAGPGDPLVFPAPRDATRPLSDMSLTQCLRRLETGRTRDDDKPETYSDVTVMHSLARSTFSTWAHDSGRFRAAVVEAALSHREADAVRAAYDDSRQAGERFERELRTLRLAWADFVCAPQERAKVVPLRRS